MDEGTPGATSTRPIGPDDQIASDWWIHLPAGIAALCVLILGTTNGNIALFLFLNRPLTPWEGQCWSGITLLGDSLVVLALTFFMVLRHPQVMARFYLLAILAAILVHGSKWFFAFPRPSAVLPPDNIWTTGPLLLHGSFPSGHATTVFALAAVLILMTPRPWWFRTVILLAAVLTAWSRVILGVHWPLDVAAGASLGWLAGAASLALPPSWLAVSRPWTIRLLGLLPLGGATLLLTPWLLDDPQHRLVRGIIGTVCLLWGCREMLRWQPPTPTPAPPEPSA